MKNLSVLRHIRRRQFAGALSLCALITMPVLVSADINSIKERPKGSQDQQWSPADDLKAIANASGVAKTPDNERNLRCWQSGQLIIYDTNWNYIPRSSKAGSISFGSNGRITKRLIIDGETTCLFIDPQGL